MTIRKTDVILSVLQSAANLLITMIASGNHTSIHPEGGAKASPRRRSASEQPPQAALSES